MHESCSLEQLFAVSTYYFCHGESRKVVDCHVFVIQVAGIAQDKWKQIAVHLGCQVHEMDKYKLKEPDSLHMRLLHILSDWQRREVFATVGALLAVCEKVQVGAAARRALRALRKE